MPPIKAGRIREDRSCRDLFFALLFLLFWVGMIIIAVYAWSTGDPRVLVYGLDYEGNLCDKDNAAKSRPGRDLRGYTFRYWVNPNQIWNIWNHSDSLLDATSVCLKSCPQPDAATVNGSFSGLRWVCKYPDAGVGVDLTMDEWVAREYDYYALLSEEAQDASWRLDADTGPCYPLLLQSSAAYWSCQYQGGYVAAAAEYWSVTRDAHGGDALVDGEGVDSLEEKLQQYVSKADQVMERYIKDLSLAWPVVLVCGVAGSLVLSFVLLLLMRYFTCLFVWLTLLLVNVLAIGATLCAYVKVGWIGEDNIAVLFGAKNTDELQNLTGDVLEPASGGSESALVAVAVIATILSAGLFIMSMVMIPRIHLAIGVLKVAVNAIAAVPSMLFYPFIPFAQMVIFVVWWVAAVIWMFSAGDIVQRDCDLSNKPWLGSECGYEVKLNEHLQWCMIYYIWGLLWSTQFIVAFTYCVIAGAAARYYWSRGEVNAFNSSPVLSSMKRTARYHLGSVATGSFITSLFQFIYYIVKYIESTSQELSQKSKLAKCMFSCVNYCLWCSQSLVGFINRNAYIVISIDGTGFCTSAWRAMTLIVENALRVSAVNIIGDTILFIGKCCVALGSALFAYIYIDYYRIELSAPLFIVLLTLIISFSIASAFMAVTEMCIDTILLSYCIDCDENGGSATNAPPMLSDSIKKVDEYRSRKG